MSRKADHVVADLIRQIVSGALPVGSVLPREADLAESYGVNRGVVREANKLLEAHGLVEPVRRRGTTVLDPRLSLSPKVLRAMLVDADGRVDLDVLREFLEIRAGMDAQLAGLAAQRRTTADLRALEAAIDALDAITDPLAYGRAVGELARVLARAARNRVFEMLVSWHIVVYADLEATLAPSRHPTAAHRQGLRFFLEVIRAGDAEMARELVLAYHEWVIEALLVAAAEANEGRDSVSPEE